MVVITIVFGIVFIGELPDKTAIAGLVLGSRFPSQWVFAGMAAAFLTHVIIAVAAGSLLTLLPHRVLDSIVALLFLLGVVAMWMEGRADNDKVQTADEQGDSGGTDGVGFWKVASLGYGVIFIAEFGDLTQILTANLAVKYHDPLSVGIGAVLGLWTVGLLAILGGKSLLRVLPLKLITRAAAMVMLGLASFTIVNVIRG